jgi:hypothetical protein
LFEEEFDTVTPINIVDKDDAFSLNELEFEDNVSQQELVGLRRPPAIISLSIRKIKRKRYRTTY